MPETITQQERLLLAAILISGRLPSIEPKLDDFTPIAAKVWCAAHELAETDQEVNCLAVWRQDQELDPVELCGIVSAFPIDLPAKHLDLMLLAFEGEIRRKREAA